MEAFVESTEPCLSLQMKFSIRFPSSRIFAFVTFVSSLTIVNAFSLYFSTFFFSLVPHFLSSGILQ